ncbi:uncharacterized protein TNCV_4312281 [Trichonephila clavipes]|nr:uncharacterized protein TNCV_4312281 [Trichonephila clavipes]
MQCQSPEKNWGALRKTYISLSSSGLYNPQTLWNKYKEYMSEDILRRLRQIHTDMPFNELIYNETLIIIENMVLAMVGKKLHDFRLISSLRVDGNDFENKNCSIIRLRF